MDIQKILIAKVYKLGTRLSFFIIILGILEIVVLNNSTKPSSMDITYLINQTIHLNPYATLYIGLIFLILTPFAAVVAISVLSILNKSYKEFFLSSAIILILILAILLGIGR